MKSFSSIAALLLVALGMTFMSAGSADACGWRCRRVVVVPATPLVPVTPVVPAVAVPAPNPIPLRRVCCRAAAYYSYVYPSYTLPGVAYGPLAYPRRDCWYDGYGRRFCN